MRWLCMHMLAHASMQLLQACSDACIAVQHQLQKFP
jgi:hypothetical protein